MAFFVHLKIMYIIFIKNSKKNIMIIIKTTKNNKIK